MEGPLAASDLKAQRRISRGDAGLIRSVKHVRASQVCRLCSSFPEARTAQGILCHTSSRSRAPELGAASQTPALKLPKDKPFSLRYVLLVTGIQSNKEMTKKIKRPKFTVPQINCDVKAGKIINPEFVVKCPAGCQDPRYHVYGTDVYASYSSVCGAAVHSGMLDNSGGKILVRKVAGQSGYKGSYSNGIQSLSLPRWRESFVVSEGKPQKGVTYPSALIYSSSKSPAAKAGKCSYTNAPLPTPSGWQQVAVPHGLFLRYHLPSSGVGAGRGTGTDVSLRDWPGGGGR
ncbi:hypothetical protein MC885_000185, partial [Smutsia gigantea]